MHNLIDPVLYNGVLSERKKKKYEPIPCLQYKFATADWHGLHQHYV